MRGRVALQDHLHHLDVGEAGIHVWWMEEGRGLKTAVTLEPMWKDGLVMNFH